MDHLYPRAEIGFGVTVVVSWLTQPPEGAEEEDEEVWNRIRGDAVIEPPGP